MSDTDSERYDIIFAGECLEGHNEAAVRAAVGHLFRADETTLGRLFSGRRQRIRRGVDADTAQRYEKAMRAAGALAFVVPVSAAGPADELPARGAELPPSGDASEKTRAAGTPAMELTPPGSDILRPEERARAGGAAPDVSHLSLAEVGSDLLREDERRRETAEVPDTSHLTLQGGDA